MPRWSRSTPPAQGARGATLFVTWSRARTTAARRRASSDPRRGGRPRRRRMPRPEPQGGRGAEALRAAGVEVELWTSGGQKQNEAWRTWAARAAPARRPQARRFARRPRRRPRPALGDRRGVATPGPRAPGGGRRGRGRDGHRARGCAAPRRAGRRRVTRQPRRLAFGRGPLPRDPSSSSDPARSTTSSRPGRGRRPVAPPRGRADDRDGVPRRRARRPPARLRRSGARGRWAADARAAPAPVDLGGRTSSRWETDVLLAWRLRDA